MDVQSAGGLEFPVEHRTRVTVRLDDGELRTGYAGGHAGDLSQPKSDRDIEEKFRSLTEGELGGPRVDAALAALWNLESMLHVSAIPHLVRFVR